MATQVDACKNIAKTITVTNLTPDPINVKWSPPSLLTSADTALSPIVKTNTDGTLIGRFSNAFGCTLIDTIPVKVHEVKPKVTASATSIYVNDVFTLSATPPGLTYSWSPPSTVTNPTAAQTPATPKEDTKYVVEVSDAFGCKDTASVFVRVLTPQCAEPFIFIPRAFTPNGDGRNEKVYVRGEYLVEMEFVIYNRWGEEVFSTRDRTQGWDGTHKGQPVCPDVYGYYVRGRCKLGEDFFKKGNITILK